MALQPDGRFRRFLQSTFGRILLIVLAAVVVFASYTYVSVIVAIPAILLFGLAIPIWSGLKRPRFLALLGLVVILVVAPMATIVYTQEIQTPIGLSASGAGAPFSVGTPLMQNASVHPFTGTASTNFTWTVTVFPTHHPVGNDTPFELVLYVSTCPGATGNSSPYCSSPYPLTVLSQTLPNTTQPYTAAFHYRIGSDGIWAWQMGIFTNNSTTGRPYFQLLIGDPTYNGIEGPVVGGFTAIYLDLLPTIYFQDLLFLGAPFYCILLVYMLFKQRERRRKEAEQRAMGPVPPAGGGPAPTLGTKAAPLPSSKDQSTTARPPPPNAAVLELNCPKCNAVVYAGEQTCWKCGAPLPASTATPTTAG